MMYEPRKVFILENGGYTQLTYVEFCNLKDRNVQYQEKLFITVQGSLIETDRVHYEEFYREKERYRYVRKLDTKNGLLSVDSFDKEDVNGTDNISGYMEDIADVVADKLMKEKLHECLSLLSDEEQILIHRYYFQNLSENKLGAYYGVTRQAINKRLIKIRSKLKKLLES